MESLLSKFPAAYLVNLPERKDRLRSASRELARISWALGPGGVRVYPAQKFDDRGRFPNPGCRGTFFSHLACLQDALDKGPSNVLLLEDDISFSSSLPRLTSSILRQLEMIRWDFCYLGHEQTGNIAHANARTAEVRLVPYQGDILQAHFVLMSGQILSRLVSHLERVATGREGDQQYGPMPVDGAYNIFRRSPDIKTLIADPKMGWQRPSRSDITPRRFDKWGPARSLMSAIRHVRYIASGWRS